MFCRHSLCDKSFPLQPVGIFAPRTMAPRLTPAELDFIQRWDSEGKTPIDMHARLTKRWGRRKMNDKWKELIKKARGQREVRWKGVRKSSRAAKAHRSTLLRSFRREGSQVEARRPRLKPDRTAQQNRTPNVSSVRGVVFAPSKRVRGTLHRDKACTVHTCT